MDLQITDKVAIITGSARGLGAATARRLAQEGAKVVNTDILAEAAEATAAGLGSGHQHQLACACRDRYPGELRCSQSRSHPHGKAGRDRRGALRRQREL